MKLREGMKTTMGSVIAIGVILVVAFCVSELALADKHKENNRQDPE
jgi:hypothetical protein